MVTSQALGTASGTVRAFVTGSFGTYRQLHSELGAEERAAFAVVLAAAFREATARRFGEDRTSGDIVEFVAEARARYPRVSESVTALDAENVIRAALGEEDLIDSMSGYAYGAAQAAMLFALTHETETPSDDIDSLLATATRQAEGYLQRRERRSDGH